MSPFRITTTTGRVLVSMMSVDRITGIHHVYVAEKGVEIGQNYMNADAEFADQRYIAHRQTTRTNSQILDHFEVYTTDNNKYEVMHIIKEDPYMAVKTDILEYTQSDCLRAIMQFYCNAHSIVIASMV